MNSYRVIQYFVVLAVVLLCVPTYGSASATDVKTLKNTRMETGLIIGYGAGSIEEGQYQPVFIIGHLGFDMKRFFSGLENHSGRLSFYLEPQINPVVGPENDIEAGIGFGLKYMYPITEYLSIYALGSIGPHYISYESADQADGFIFTDTIGAGFSFFLTENSAINIGYRFRHLSNADINEPNNGINTQSGTIGFSVFF